jgi:hypothetical protein
MNRLRLLDREMMPESQAGSKVLPSLRHLVEMKTAVAET